VLTGRVGNPLDAGTHGDAVKEGKRRIAEGLPPGYKDRNKDDDLAVGDYLVWEQLLREADRRHCDVLLVTGDVKDDWWWRERGQTRGPRLELAEELRNRAGVQLFLLRPESLLVHAKDVLDVKVSDESLQDVERVDRFLSVDESGGWTPEAVQYDEGRSLRGFTRPPNRIAQEFRDRGIVPAGAVDVLKPVYDPAFSYVQASGFGIPEELIPLIRRAATQAS
jgi:hypothetical protein